MSYIHSQSTFHYDSKYWSDKTEYKLPGGEAGFDSQETKLPTYWNTSFSKICLGMKIGQQINFIVINKKANSQYSLIADGQYRATSLGRNTWKTLIGSEASLQEVCNTEGFNAEGDSTTYSKARIGIVGNEQNHCSSCDSRIGFGTAGYSDDSNTKKTKQCTEPIMETNTSKPRVTSCCSDEENINSTFYQTDLKPCWMKL